MIEQLLEFSSRHRLNIGDQSSPPWDPPSFCFALQPASQGNPWVSAVRPRMPLSSSCPSVHAPELPIHISWKMKEALPHSKDADAGAGWSTKELFSSFFLLCLVPVYIYLWFLGNSSSG